VSVRGGILADDMGMGKSVQILGLWLAHPPDPNAQAYGSALPPAPKVAKYHSWSKKELQKACRVKGLATTGTKDVLTQRLLQPAAEDVVDLTGDTPPESAAVCAAADACTRAWRSSSSASPPCSAERNAAAAAAAAAEAPPRDAADAARAVIRASCSFVFANAAHTHQGPSLAPLALLLTELHSRHDYAHAAARAAFNELTPAAA
jgi:hypothetical protein